MDTAQIVSIIAAVAPSVVAIGTCIGAFVGIIKKFVDLRRECLDLKNVKDVNDKLSQVLEENYELKKKLNETLTKIDHVRRDNGERRK